MSLSPDTEWVAGNLFTAQRTKRRKRGRCKKENPVLSETT